MFCSGLSSLYTAESIACSRRSDNRARQLGDELSSSAPGKRGGGGDSERFFSRLQTLSTNPVTESGMPSYWSIMTPVTTRALATLMRNAILRERDICYRIAQTSRLL